MITSLRANGRTNARPMTGSAKQSIARAVIASEAKQSIAPRKERMDCFAALAMTVSGRWHSTAHHTLSRHRPPTGRDDGRVRFLVPLRTFFRLCQQVPGLRDHPLSQKTGLIGIGNSMFDRRHIAMGQRGICQNPLRYHI